MLVLWVPLVVWHYWLGITKCTAALKQLTPNIKSKNDPQKKLDQTNAVISCNLDQPIQHLVQ